MYEKTTAMAELGLGGAWDTLQNMFKTGSDVYQAHKNAEAAKSVATAPAPAVPQQSFIQKHGTKLLIGGVALGAFLFIRSRRRRA